jgi:eukaryotic-like serine/threonine-protein kinase
LRFDPEPSVHLLCPHCKNPIELVRIDPRQEITCTACGSSFRIDDSSTTGWTTPVGQTIGRFSLIEMVGQRGFGTVFKAHDPELDRIVAVEVSHGSNVGEAPADADRILREANNVTQLRHPGIVSLYEVGTFDGAPYLVSEFVEGTALSNLLTTRRPPPCESAKLIAEVADALHYAHEHWIVHRDIKPSNIVIRPDFSPVVMGFGSADRELGEINENTDRQIICTPAYMSPEQARGKGHRVDRRSDIYSLGVILYQLLAGELPFRGNTRMLLHQVLHDEPKPPRSLNDEIPRDLETICLKAMAKDPRRRYATSGELAAVLRRFLNGEPVKPRRVGSIARAAKWVWRNRVGSIARAAKWVWRNRVATGLTVMVFLILLAGTIGIYTEYADADRAAKDANDRAEELRYQLALSNLILASNALDNRDMRTAVERLELVPPDLRHWEWDYLKRQTQDGICTYLVLRGHEHAIFAVAFSPDGSRIVTGSFDETAKVWDARTGTVLLDLKGHAKVVWSVAFSPDGSRIATGSADNTAKVWDARTGTLLLDLKGHMDFVRSVAFSPDGSRIVTSSDDNTAKVWDAQTGTPLLDLKGHTEGIWSAAYSPDGSRIVTGSNDRTAKVWDAQTGALLLDLKAGRTAVSGEVESVAFSPDGSRIATASDGTAKVWDARSGTLLCELKGRGAVERVAFSPDGSRIVAGSNDGTAKVYDARTGTLVLELKGHSDTVLSAAFSSDGTRIVSGSFDHTAIVWDAAGPTIAELLPATKSDKISNLYPLELGNCWDYEVKAGPLRWTSTYTVDRIESVDGKTVARLEHDGKIKTSDHWSVNETGVYRHRNDGVEFDPPVCFVQYPFKAGASWTAKYKLGARTDEAKRMVDVKASAGDPVEIEVPAGKFKAFPVTLEAVQNGTTAISTYYFAEGVGIVRQVEDSGDMKVQKELKRAKLKRFTPGGSDKK